MLACEARCFGIGWPLPSGWFEWFRHVEITERQTKALERALVNYTRQKERDAKKKARKNKNTDGVYRRLQSADKAVGVVAAMLKHGGIDPQSKEFLASPAWRRLRYAALAKYGNKCSCCGATPEGGAVMNVDHIKPRAIYPDLALRLDNLQVLCGDCNQGKGNWDATTWRKA